MPDEPLKADPPFEEQLVAYLDGELDSESSRRIEERLATDAQLRGKLQELDRAWDLLDELDRTQCPGKFTQTTLEMVTSAASEDARQTVAEAPRRRRRRWTIAAGSLLTTGVAGFLALAYVLPDPNRELIRDLPVLENLDQYRWIDDVEFLQMLHEQDLFAEEESDEP